MTSDDTQKQLESFRDALVAVSRDLDVLTRDQAAAIAQILKEIDTAKIAEIRSALRA